MATIYDGRPLEAREIRLLEICPGEWMHEIQCKLRFKSLDESHSIFETRLNYCCLSYVWGTEPRNVKIEVDGEEILITPNLDRAIRHYRRRMGAGNKRNIFGRLLWVDSVCINQENKEELSRQVAMMNDIFALSRNSIIFLGDGLQPQMRFYQDYLNALTYIPFKAFGRHEANDYELLNENGLLTDNHDSHMLYQMDATILLQFLEDVRNLPNGMHVSSILADLGNVHHHRDPVPIVINSLCRGFKHFTESSWWERAWTLQEAVAGRYCVFILGTSVCTWNLLRESARKLRVHSYRGCCPQLTGEARSTPLFKYLDKFVEMIFSMNRSMSLYEIGSTQEGTSHEFDEYDFAMNELFGSFNRKRSGLPFVADYLLRLLQKHRERHAADPRDKVFAVLPLAKWVGTSPIMYPSYAKSISEVYVDTTQTIISNSGYLDALAIAASTGGYPNVPSWVPEWSSHDNLDDNARITSLERYSATLDKTSDAEFDNNKLRVNAVVFGNVQYCGKAMVRKRPLWKTVHHWAQLAERHINNLSPNSPKGPTTWKDFCRAIHGDMIFIDGMTHTYRLTVTLDDADLTWASSSDLTGQLCFPDKDNSANYNSSISMLYYQ